MYSFETKGDLFKFLQKNIINTAEACEILGCKRQNIDYLVKTGKLIPVRALTKDKVFFKEDILERLKYKK